MEFPSPSWAQMVLGALVAWFAKQPLINFCRLILERKKPAAEIASIGAQTQKTVADSATELMSSALDFAKSLKEAHATAQAEIAELRQIVTGQGRALEESNRQHGICQAEVAGLKEEVRQLKG